MEPLSSSEVTHHEEYLFQPAVANISKYRQNNQICTICNLKIEGGTFFDHLATVHGSTKNQATVDLKYMTGNLVPKTNPVLKEKKLQTLSMEEQLKKFNIKPCGIILMKCEMIKSLASKYRLEKDVASQNKVVMERSKTSLKRAKLHLCSYPNCGKSFSLKHTLQIHNRIHTGEKPYKCKVCFQRFSQTNGLASHERTHTGEKPFHCTICPLRFAQSGSLSRHSRIHTLGQAYVTCPSCRKLINSSLINSHMKTVHGIQKQVLQEKAVKSNKNIDKVSKSKAETGKANGNKFLCRFPNCEKKLKSKMTLQTHYRTHTGEKRYECQVCSKRFKYSGGLSVHKRIHTGNKPYQCKVCLKQFSQSSSLSVHASVHTGETFKCPYCSRRCRLKSTLKLHIRNVHGSGTRTGSKQDFIETGSLSGKVIRKTSTTKSCREGPNGSSSSEETCKVTNGTIKTTQRKQKRKRISCDKGGQILLSNRNLEKQINNTHLSENSDKQVFACLACPKRDISNLQNHIKRVHGLELGANFNKTLLLVKN